MDSMIMMKILSTLSPLKQNLKSPASREKLELN